MKYWGLGMYFTFLAAFIVIADSTASAEFLCRQSVTYQWSKAKEDKPTDVHWITVESRGKTEDDAKSSLDEPITREQKRAKEDCQKEHENLAGCVAAKYSSLAPTLERLGFSQRKGVEEAIQNDCQLHQGICKLISLGEIHCSEIASAKAEGSTGSEGAGKDAKDSKGAKKK
jgi:hypothetical protein